MKNHIVFKFLAIVLCAAALLSAVGSGLGIAVLMSADLYNESAENFYQERIQSDCEEYAQSIAFRYASIQLGGCPEAMLNDYSSDYWFYDSYNALSVGYQLTDASGNVLVSQPLEDVDDAKAYVFHIDGEYMQLLSVKPVSEWNSQEKDPEYPQIDVNSGIQIYDAVPDEGTAVFQVHFYNTEGSEIFGLEESAPIGYIFRNQNGGVVFRTLFLDNLMLPDTTVNGAIFCDEYGKLIFEAFSSDGVGRLAYNEDGNLVFTCSVSETEETAGSEGEFVIFDAIPEEGTEVSHLSISFSDGRSEGMGSDEGIGRLSVDAVGNVTFQPYDPGSLELPESAQVTHILFQNGNEELVYEAACEDGAGTLCRNEQGAYIFSSDVFSYRLESDPTLSPEATEAAGLESEPGETAEQTEPEATALSETVPEETEAGSALVAVPDATEAAADNSDSVPDEAMARTVPETETVIPGDTADVVVPTETWAAMTESGEAAYSDRNISSYGYYDSRAGETMYAEYCFAEMPEYTVDIVLGPDAFRYESAYSMLRLVWRFRNELFLVLGISLLLFAALAVYLSCAAGRKPGTDAVHAGGVNCIPLDLYLVGAGLGITGIVCLMAEAANYLLRQTILVSGILVATAGFVCALLFVCFCFAFAAQVKTPGAYWWHNSLCGRCLKLLGRILRGVWRGCLWLKGKAPKFLSGLWSFIKRFFSKLWILACWLFQYVKRHIGNVCRLLKKGASWVGRKLARFYGLLPLTWQWLLTGMILLVLLFAAIATRSEGMLVLCLCGCVAIVLYGASAFGTLLESAKRMSKGDLESKVEDKYLIGCFKDFAEELNALAGVAVVAAQKQLKSERMKTELITNVSHDIKTPLTSIINYVDLMQKPHSPEEQEMYLEVLSRQSQRLKKLIEDLMEMSKASTGNLQVDIIQINAAEAINQSLGEFADKLDAAQLTPVFRQPEDTVIMMADGRLVWRVMSNLLSNAVKYALPGTRLYVDLMKLDGKVVISMKNISREELNVSVDELLERFVRGDAARNTEGSGLGLNIAQSLMELQKGQLQLMVDGDLFKVTLIFPGA